MNEIVDTDSQDNERNTDILDNLYEAFKTGKSTLLDDLNEMCIDQAYVVIGAYAYTFTPDGPYPSNGKLCMFPYKSNNKDNDYHVRPHWLEGVIVDRSIKSGNPDIWRNMELSGFPFERLESVVRDLLNVQDIMRQCRMNYETH